MTNTIIPNINSYPNNFLLKKSGSKNAENNDAVARHITATEIFDTLIAPKKKNQCNATIAPIPNSGRISFFLIVFICFFIKRKINGICSILPGQ